MAKSPMDEACCQETINECKMQYKEDLKGLHEALEFVRQQIHEGNVYPREIVPDINITSEDGHESSMYTACHTSSKDRLSTTLEATDEVSCASVIETTLEKPNVSVNRTCSTNSTAVGGKKKFRLRKMGSRQNSKTETESSDEGNAGAAETPRRMKRKNFRLKQRSFDDDYRRFENNTVANLNEDEPFRRESKPTYANYNMATSKSLVTLNESSKLFSIPEPINGSTEVNMNSNVFVKTKRKVFTTVKSPTTIDGLTVIGHDLDANEENEEHVKDQKDVGEHNMQEQEKHNSPNCEHDKLVLPTNKRILTTQKSQSLEDLLNPQHDEESRIRSTESLNALCTDSPALNLRAPLATDIIRLQQESLPNTNSVTVEKNETKMVINHSNTLKHDKSDNTIPKISRRSTRHSLTPTTVTSQQLNFEFPSVSEPGTPFVDNEETKPTTPLSERAQKIRKAKEEFLTSHAPHNHSENIIRKESLDHSHQSLSSTAGTEANGNLSKSVSADTFTAATTDAGTDVDSSNYESLPRVSRSAKFTSKLGLSTLASKFRRSKTKTTKDKENLTDSSGSALSALCKHTLMAEIIAAPQMAKVEERVYGVAKHECIAKSKSSPAATAAALKRPTAKKNMSGRVWQEIERLNKSQSDKYIEPKESYV